MRVVIDRLEGDFAVVELSDGSVWSVPRALFCGAVEGDCFVISKDGREKERRGKRVQEEFDRLKK